MLVFAERGKPEYPEKNLSEQRREPTTNSTHIWRRVRESNPGHIGGRRVLSPLRHPCSPKKSLSFPSPYPHLNTSHIEIWNIYVWFDIPSFLVWLNISVLPTKERLICGLLWEGLPFSGGSYCNYRKIVLTPERKISLLVKSIFTECLLFPVLVLVSHCHSHCYWAMKKRLSSFSHFTEAIWYVINWQVNKVNSSYFFFFYQ